MLPLILASASPRRAALMRLITPDFTVQPSRFDESSVRRAVPSELTAALARGKAGEVAARFPEAVVVGCDTVVERDGKVFGKPASPEDAYRMLLALSGGVHTVLTGVCVLFPGGEEHLVSETRVKFYPLSEEEIRAYILTGEPYDKAGGYGIQEKGGLFVEEIQGDYYNVVGLPVARVYRILQQIRHENL